MNALHRLQAEIDAAAANDNAPAEALSLVPTIKGVLALAAGWFSVWFIIAMAEVFHG